MGVGMQACLYEGTRMELVLCVDGLTEGKGAAVEMDGREKKGMGVAIRLTEHHAMVLIFK
jgi:hypothetical protein